MVLWAIIDITRGYLKTKPEEKKVYLVKNLTLTAVVIVVLFLSGPFFMISPIKLGYSTLFQGGVTLYYPSSHAESAEEIFTMAKQAAEKNDEFYRTATNTRVLIAVSNLDMLRFGVYPKANGGGLPWGIVIRESRASWNIVAHEMSHKNLAKISSVVSSILSFPRWFDEGLASYIGRMDWYITPSELKEDLHIGRYRRDITKWKGLPGIFQWLNQTFYQRNTPLIYGQTYLMVKYLFDTYGEDKVCQLLLNCKEMSFEKAFESTFGLSIDQYHQQFIQFIEKS